MAVAVGQAVDPSFLLTQWQADGWQQIRTSILTPVPVDSAGNVDAHVTVEGFEWTDVALFGIGSLDNAISQMQQAIQQRGSNLYCWAMFSQPVFDALGVKVTKYRLVFVHSQVQLLTWAVAILAAAFAAVIFIQYMTTGHSAALQDLQQLFGSAVSSVASGVGTISQAVITPYVVAAGVAGLIALGLSIGAKRAGVAAPKVDVAPHGSFGLNAGGFSTKVTA